MRQSDIVIGIDPGTRITGYAVIATSRAVSFGGEVLDLGIIRLKASLPYLERIVLLHDEIAKIISQSNPQHAVLEKAFFGINAASALKLGETRGAMLMALSQAKVQVHNISTAEVKKGIAGNGRATKQQVATAVAGMYNLNLTNAPADATDALAIASSFHLCKQQTYWQQYPAHSA